APPISSDLARAGGGSGCGGGRSDLGASPSDIVAVAQAIGCAARSADGADRSFAKPGAGREVRADRASIAARSASQPAVETGRAAPGHPIGRSAAARG